MKLSFLMAAALIAASAQAAPNNTGRGVYANNPLVREVIEDTSPKVKLVKAMKSFSTVSGKQNCGAGKVGTSPVISASTVVGFDEAGIARVTTTKVEIKGCKGTSGPQSAYLINEKQEAVLQTKLGAGQATQLSLMLTALESNPKECGLTLTLNKSDQITDLKGCKNDSP